MIKDIPAPTPDVEVLKASIEGFEGKFPDYEEKAEAYRRASQEAWRLYEEAKSAHIKLSLERHELADEQERVVRTQLNAEGFAICSAANRDTEPFNHHHHQYEGTVWGSTEPLRKYGVFREDEMTMVYSRHTNEIRRKEGLLDSFDIVTSTDFRILCPQHAPEHEKENYSRPSGYGEQYGPDEWTRIVAKDGKLVRELDGKEVGASLKQGHVDSALYRHFESPSIPNLPEEVRHS